MFFSPLFKFIEVKILGQITKIKIESGAIAAGATTATVYSEPIRGIIRAVRLIYSGTHDMTVDLYEMNTFDPDDVSDALQHILDIAASGATPAADNTVYYPHRSVQDYTGNDMTYDATRVVPTPFVVYGILALDINAGTAGDSVVAEILVEEF